MRSFRYRCDILIVLTWCFSRSHIPTAEELYSRTVKLKELLLCPRAKNAAKQCYVFVLQMYELIGHLHELENSTLNNRGYGMVASYFGTLFAFPP